MEDGKNNQSGFALVYALGAITIATLLLFFVFWLSRLTFQQIETVDSFTRIRDIQEYSLQQATYKIEKDFEEFLQKTPTEQLGKDEQQIRNYITSTMNGFKEEARDIGRKKQFDYHVSLAKDRQPEVHVILPYTLNNSLGEQGYQQSPVFIDGKVNVEVTVPLETTVYERKADQTVERTAQGEYVMQVQWDVFDAAAIVTELDIWRHTVFPYQLPNSGQQISAEQWIRKMFAIKGYQEGLNQQKNFDFSSYQGYSTVDFHSGSAITVDYTTQGYWDSRNQPIGNIYFPGSFFLDQGYLYNPGTSHLGYLETSSLFYVGSSANNSTMIENVSVWAHVGAFFESNGMTQHGNNQLVLTAPAGNQRELVAGNLFIHSANEGLWENEPTNAAVVLSQGGILLGEVTKGAQFDFSSYLTPNSQQGAVYRDPKDALWYAFNNGSMVIANSSFSALPLASDSGSGNQRLIEVNGNFMLTSARHTDELDVAGGLSYVPPYSDMWHDPSVLTLADPGTQMTVKGLSFIDAPKFSRRPSEGTGEASAIQWDNYFTDQDYWNQIRVLDGAHLELGYTGVEPFVLEVGENAVFSLKCLPGLAYFDFQFLEDAYHYNRLKGQVILEPFNVEDLEKLEAQLKLRNIPYQTVSQASQAEDGMVSIIETRNTEDTDSNYLITRTFNYMKTINY